MPNFKLKPLSSNEINTSGQNCQKKQSEGVRFWNKDKETPPRVLTP